MELGHKSWLRMIIQDVFSGKMHLLSVCIHKRFVFFFSLTWFPTIYIYMCVYIYIYMRKGNRDISSGFDSAMHVSNRKRRTYFSG